MSLRAERVLLAWEHGRNLGHVARLSATARLFEQGGARVVWALPGGFRGRGPLLAPGHAVHRGPRVASLGIRNNAAPQSYADVLIGLGFADPAALQQTVAAWIELFEAEAIDRVMLDYAPAAQLAALVAGLPAHQITNGFDAPPPGCPLYDVGMRGPMLEERNRRRVQLLDESIAAVGAALGAGRGLSLERWLSYPARWYDCIPETDPYGPRVDGVYVGPIGAPTETVRAQWPGKAGSAMRVFAYLRSTTQARRVLRALSSAAAQVVCVWPGAPDGEADRWSGLGVNVVDRPVDLAQVLPRCDAVVNYGSTTLVCQSLLAGKPQLMLPTDIEKWMVAGRVHRQGAGVVLHSRASEAALAMALESVLNDGRVRSRAKAIAGACRPGRMELGPDALGTARRSVEGNCGERRT